MRYLLSELTLTTTTEWGFRRTKENLSAIALTIPNIHWGEDLTPAEVLKEWDIRNGFYIVYIEGSVLAFQRPPIPQSIPGKDDRIWIATNGDRYKAFNLPGEYITDVMLIKLQEDNNNDQTN